MVPIGEKCKTCRYGKDSYNGYVARCTHPNPENILTLEGWKCDSFRPKLVLKTMI